jgi:RHS repeat-associated protein
VTGRLLDGNGGGTPKQAELVSAQGYEAFGSLLPGRNYSSSSYRFGFNGMEKDDEIHGSTGTSYDFGARLYDPRFGRWLSLDPLASGNATWSPYSFGLDNPVVFIDKGGEWPGVTFLFFEMDLGLGLGYGLNYIEQEGLAYDDVGETHFTMTSAVYVINQNLEGHRNDARREKYFLGAGGGLSLGVKQNWSASTFTQAAGLNSAGGTLPTSSSGAEKGKLKLRASLGLGISLTEDDFALTLGLQAGVKLTNFGSTVKHSISLTDQEAGVVNDATDVIFEKWRVGERAYDSESKQWCGVVFTENTKGESINTGIRVYSANITDDEGNSAPTNIWMSRNYRSEAAAAERKK